MSKVKLLIALVWFILSISPTSFSANPNDEYKDILARLVPPSIHYNITVEKNSIVKGFKQLNVAIENKEKGVVRHKYLWISNDKKIIIPTVFENKNGKFKRVRPEQSIERKPVDLSWFFEMIDKLPKEMKKSYGKGKDVYMLSDPYCPFCKMEIEELVKLAKDNKIKLHIIPFDVHGKRADKASLIFIDIENNKGLLEAINKIGKAKFKDVDKEIEKNKDKLDKLKAKYSKYLQQVGDTVYNHGIHGTPVVVIPTKGKSAYIIVGLEDISQYAK